MRSFARLAVVAALLGAPLLLNAQSTPSGKDAKDVLAQLESDATAGNKHILLQFGASWCGNCKLFDLFLNDSVIHPIMSKAFVFGEMATGEHAGQTRHLNLPGGVELENTLGGKNVGWPYLVMLDQHGAPLAGSVAPKTGNIGYPASPEEIDWFITMLRKSAPSLTPQDLSTIQTWLKDHSPAHA